MSMFGIDIINAQGGYLTEKQLIEGNSAGYVSPAVDLALIDIKRKQYQDALKKKKEALLNTNLINTLSIPKGEPIQAFDITSMDKIRQSVSKKLLGTAGLRIPLKGGL